MSSTDFKNIIHASKTYGIFKWFFRALDEDRRVIYLVAKDGVSRRFWLRKSVGAG